MLYSTCASSLPAYFNQYIWLDEEGGAGKNNIKAEVLLNLRTFSWRRRARTPNTCLYPSGSKHASEISAGEIIKKQ